MKERWKRETKKKISKGTFMSWTMQSLEIGQEITFELPRSTSAPIIPAVPELTVLVMSDNLFPRSGASDQGQHIMRFDSTIRQANPASNAKPNPNSDTREESEDQTLWIEKREKCTGGVRIGVDQRARKRTSVHGLTNEDKEHDRTPKKQLSSSLCLDQGNKKEKDEDFGTERAEEHEARKNKRAARSRSNKERMPRAKKNLDHFSICACHPCAGAMLIFSVSFQFYRMSPKRQPCRQLCGIRRRESIASLSIWD